MVRQQYFRVSLAGQPEIRTSGAFADESADISWTQPRDLWQALLLEHSGVFTMNGHTFEVEPFDFVIVPPSSRNEVHRTGEAPYVYSYFTFCPEEGVRDEMALPLHSRLGEEGRFWNLNFRRGLSRLQTSRTSLHIVARSMLWAVAQEVASHERNVYVAEAERMVIEGLADTLRIDQLAKRVGISQGQLSRLFLAEHGRTPLQYIRDARAEHAHRLLTTTTTPLKQVGTACGYPNPHHFNRFVRERLGASPRAIRNKQVHVDVFRVKMYTASLDKA